MSEPVDDFDELGALLAEVRAGGDPVAQAAVLMLTGDRYGNAQIAMLQNLAWELHAAARTCTRLHFYDGYFARMQPPLLDVLQPLQCHAARCSALCRQLMGVDEVTVFSDPTVAGVVPCIAELLVMTRTIPDLRSRDFARQLLRSTRRLILERFIATA